MRILVFDHQEDALQQAVFNMTARVESKLFLILALRIEH